jgi:hypothetical protein
MEGYFNIFIFTYGRHVFIVGLCIFKLLRSPGIDSARLCSLAGRYDKHIPPRFLAHIDCSIIPAQIEEYVLC